MDKEDISVRIVYASLIIKNLFGHSLGHNYFCSDYLAVFLDIDKGMMLKYYHQQKDIPDELARKILMLSSPNAEFIARMMWAQRQKDEA